MSSFLQLLLGCLVIKFVLWQADGALGPFSLTLRFSLS